MISVKMKFVSKIKNKKGLTQLEAEEKLKQYGTNELVSRGKVSPITLFLGNSETLLLLYF